MDIFAPNDALKLFCFHLACEMLREKPSAPLYLTTERQNDVFFAHAKLGEYSETQTASLSEHFTEKRTENVAVGKALFYLFSKLNAVDVPYGTLVGVRPVKIALFYLSRGKKEEEMCALLERDYCMHKSKAALLCQLAKTERETEQGLNKNDAMLYLSIPFCPSRCRYCSFISQSAPKQLASLPEYVQCMKEELTELAALFNATGRRLRAVYLGGGTPGLLNAKELTELFDCVKRAFPLSDSVEYTAELGRPDTITQDKCNALKDTGIGRICINPQSLCDDVLKENGRCHTKDDFLRAFEMARRADLPSINTDLIAGLNGDTPEGFLKSVEEILSLAPENLTIHALCKKRASDEEFLPPDDTDRLWSGAMSTAEKSCIKDAYLPYYLYRQKNTIANLENLGYTKKGHSCLYNIAMMEDLCDVFAAGAGAMTKLRKNTKDGYSIVRLPSYKYPAEYLNDPEKGRKNRIAALNLCTEQNDV